MYTHTTAEGDTISRIAWQYYGTSAAQVEEILEANPGLCRQPALLPAGIAVRLPAEKTAAPATMPTVNLWD